MRKLRLLADSHRLCSSLNLGLSAFVALQSLKTLSANPQSEGDELIIRRTGTVAALAVALLLTAATPAFAVQGDILYHDGFHQGAVSDSDQGNVIKIDSGGNPVVAGDTSLIAGQSALDTLSLGGDTLWRWESAYGVPSYGARGTDLALDGWGNAFAVGWTDTAAKGHDIVVLFTAALTGTATPHTWNGRPNKDDEARAVAVASDGTCYVTGMSQARDGDMDVITIKYGPAGDLQWAKRYNSPWDGFDSGFAICRKGTALYVAGASRHPGHGDDLVLIRYDAMTGARKWTRFYDDDLRRSESVSGVVATSSGVYVAGSGKGDALLVKYTSSGTRRWNASIAGSRGMFDGWTDIALAPGGYINLTGFIYKTGTGDNVLTASYRANGTLRWGVARTFSSDGNHLDLGNGLVVDADGKTYVGGVLHSIAGGDDALALCYAANGAREWWNTYDGVVAGGDAMALDVGVSADAVWLTGVTATPANGDDLLMVKLEK